MVVGVIEARKTSDGCWLGAQVEAQGAFPIVARFNRSDSHRSARRKSATLARHCGKSPGCNIELKMWSGKLLLKMEKPWGEAMYKCVRDCESPSICSSVA